MPGWGNMRVGGTPADSGLGRFLRAHPAAGLALRIVLALAALGVLYAWWTTARHGSVTHFLAAAIATAGLAAALLGYLWRHVVLLAGGLLVCALAAPVRLGFLGNLVALAVVVAVVVYLIRRPRRV